MTDQISQTAGEPSGQPYPMRGALESFGRNWWLFLILGILLVLGGISAILTPIFASLAVTIAVGAALTVGGVFKFLHALRSEGWEGRGWSIISSIIYFIGGLLLLLNPLAGMVSLTLLMIVLIGVDGLIRIILAFRIRQAAGWGWLLAGGIVSLLLAILMTIALPWISLTMLGLLAGIALIFEGSAFIAMSLAVRKLRTFGQKG